MTVHYKDRNAPAGTIAITIKIVFVIYATIPVYIAAIELYRRAPFRVQSTGIGYLLVAVLVVLTYYDFRRLKQSAERMHPWFSFLQICISIAVVTIVNLTAGGNVGTYYVLFLLPVMIASVMGDLVMIGATWALALAALGLVIFRKGDHSADTLFWTLAVSGAAWGGAAMAIHFAVKQFLGAIHSAQQVSRLASAAQDVQTWPAGLATCTPLLADIMGAELVRVMAGPTGSPLEPVAVFDRRQNGAPVAGAPSPSDDGAAPVDEFEEGIRQATDTRRVSWVGRSTFVPNRTASGIDIVIIGTRQRVPTVPTTGVTNAVIAGQLVGGIVDRVSLIGGLREEAVTDPLTGLANRRGMYELLDRMLAHADRTREPFSLVMLDIDRFKQFYDVFGHLAGDAVLRSIGAMLRAGVRLQDVVVRFGGEEFCLLLPATGRDGAASLVNQLRVTATKRSDVPGVSRPTFSAGIAQWDGTEGRQSLISRADTALYRAKDAGRDAVSTDAETTDMRSARPMSGSATEEQPDDGAEEGDDDHDLDRQPDQPGDEVQQGEGHHHRDDGGSHHQYTIDQLES